MPTKAFDLAVLQMKLDWNKTGWIDARLARTLSSLCRGYNSFAE
jgi:hypothetical protein